MRLTLPLHGVRRAICYCALAGVISLAPPARAQSLLVNDVNTIATADQAVPVEHSFTVPNPGTFQVTLTDLGQTGANAPLASVQLGITFGSTLVTSLAQAGFVQFNAAAAGTYVVRVVGKPGPTVGSGPFGVSITNVSDGSQLAGASFVSTLALPPSAASNVASLNDAPVTVPADGTYTLTLTDLQFPQFLTDTQVALVAQGGGAPLATLAIANGQPAASVQQTVSLLASGSYTIVGFGGMATSAPVNAGLFAVVLRDSTNAIVYAHVLTVGTVNALGTVSLAGGTYALDFTDLKFPVALAGTAPTGAIVLLGDKAEARLTAPGKAPSFADVSGTYAIFSLGAASATPGTGSYEVDLVPTDASGNPTGAPAFSSFQPVATSGSNQSAYGFSAAVTAAGNYQIQLADYQTPAPMTSITLIAAQNGTILTVPALSAAGSAVVPAAIGNLGILVFAQPPSGGGVIGLFVTPSSGGAPVLELTQGIGAPFTSRKVTLPASGNYQVTLADVGFPANVPSGGSFATLYALVTQGTTLLGSILGGGTLPFTATSAGDYFVTFTAQPAAPSKAGTYALTLGLAPPAPVVNLTSSATQVASGGSATLSWTTQNATSCTASGGWSGSQPLSGSNVSTGALTADTTFTLSCTGAGGTTQQSVTIKIASSSGGGGGGGGRLGEDDLILLALLAALRLAAARRAERATGVTGVIPS